MMKKKRVELESNIAEGKPCWRLGFYNYLPTWERIWYKQLLSEQTTVQEMDAVQSNYRLEFTAAANDVSICLKIFTGDSTCVRIGKTSFHLLSHNFISKI